MLDFAIDLINQAASNSFVVFCFCNVIIAVILRGSKPGSNFDQERLESLSTSAAIYDHANEKRNLKSSDSKKVLSADVTGIQNADDELVKENDKHGDGDDIRIYDHYANEKRNFESPDSEKDLSDDVTRIQNADDDIVKENDKNGDGGEGDDIRIYDHYANEKRNFESPEAKEDVSADVTGLQNADDDILEENDKNDELRRRVEEFIAKVNKKLKEEKRAEGFAIGGMNF